MAPSSTPSMMQDASDNKFTTEAASIVAASGPSQHPKDIGARNPNIDRLPMTMPPLMMPSPLRVTGASPMCINGLAGLAYLNPNVNMGSNRTLSPVSPKSISSKSDRSATPPPMQWRRSSTPPSGSERTTPENNKSCCVTPPLMVQARTLQKPVLMKALYTKDVTTSSAQILDILKQNPDVINEPFWDHDCEPPLCCAVRLQRPAAIVQLLLEHGACPEDTDRMGRTAARIAAEAPAKAWMHRVPPFVVGTAPHLVESRPRMGPFGDLTMENLLLLDEGYAAQSTYLPDVNAPMEKWRAEIAELFKVHSKV